MAGFKERRLAPESITRTVAAAGRLLEKARRFPLKNFLAVATSAAREAFNAKELLDRFEAQLNLKVEVIEGEEEAYLTFKGVRAGLEGAVKEPLVVVDVGGGSTEFAWEEKGRLNLRSVPLGAVRCTERATALEEIEEILSPVLEDLRGRFQPSPFKPSLPSGSWTVIGTGGTATTLAALELGLKEYRSDLVHGLSLPWKRVNYWLKRLASLPVELRRKLPGLQPERADIIVAGVTILEAILRGLEAQRLMISEADLLWGLLLKAAGEE
jgi:exopolyphosphatase/guanosine-5'-triphosphate,3'-diphosphate pyrophosphatase